MGDARQFFAPRVGGVLSADIAVPEHEREACFYSRVLTTGPSPLWRDDLMNNLGIPSSVWGRAPRKTRTSRSSGCLISRSRMWQKVSGAPSIWAGEAYKRAVKTTFARGASLDDPAGLFNASLAGTTRRAIDFHEGDRIDEEAFRARG